VGTVRPVHADSLPDLAVDSIWLEEASSPGQAVAQAAPGDQFLIVASIKNLGSATASGSYIDVYYDSEYGRGGPDNIAPGEVQIWYVSSLTAQAGTHTTKWIVDPDNQIAELDETNNEKDYTFTIGSQTTNTSTTITSSTSTTTASFLKDTTPPVITPTVTPSANGNGWNNGSVTITWSFSDPESGIGSSIGCTTATLSTETSPAGTTLTCTATNGAGLSNSASVTVKIDLTAPTLTLPSLTVEATGPSGALVSYDAGASDSLSGLNTLSSCTPPSGSTFPIATTAVSCSATDKAGNSASGTFTVTVQDKTPPALTVPTDMTVDATGPSGAVATFTVSALDVVDGSSTPTCAPSSGSTFALGSTKVMCSATDKSGNTGSASFNVNVVDEAPPKLTLPSDMTVQATSARGAVVNFSVSASDLVDGSVPVTCTPASGSTFPLGTTTVTCSAKDKAGNSVTGSFEVTVPAVIVKLLASNGNGLSGGVVQYYSGGWKLFGTTGSDGTVSKPLPSGASPGTYSFQISYAGATQQISQNIGTNPTVVFQTTLVTMKLLSSTNTELGGAAQYYAGSWKTFGGGTTTTTMELLPLTYNFQISYAGAGQQKSQNVASNPNVVFQTTLVTMSLISSTNDQLSGGAYYYAGSWKIFGAGTTTTSMELLPLTYNFGISYAGAGQQKSQNVASDPNVVFRTVQVHSDSGKCTSYYAGGWKTFTQDMQLLPGTYTFRFSDGTASTSYMLVVGAVMHIH
jgi:hypothetical protein